MHTRTAEMLALPTELAGEVAFFRSSSSSFFIGMLRKAPAMAQLGSEEQLLGKELGKPINIPELESALLPKTSFQISLWQLTLQLATNIRAYNQMSLWQLTLQIASNIRAYMQMSLWQIMFEIAFRIRAYMQMSLWQLTLQRAFSLRAYNRKSLLGSKPSNQRARRELLRISLML